MKAIKIHPIQAGVLFGILPFLVGVLFAGIADEWGSTKVIIMLGVIIGVFGGVIMGVVAYFNDRGSRIGKHLSWGLLIFCGIILCLVFIGGIDIDPIDDNDLLLSENSMPYNPEGNGWSILSNVMSQVESIENELAKNETNLCPRSETYIRSKDKLCWYANPSNKEYLVDCIVEQDPDCLSHFTNTIATCEYVAVLLKTNEWLLAGIDSAIAADRYAPPPVNILTGDQFYLPVSEMLSVNRSFLLARVRYEFDRGNYDAGVDELRKALGLATLLQTKSGTFIEYLVGMKMIEEDVLCINQILADSSLPKLTLVSLNDSLGILTGFTSNAMSHALKREYAYFRENVKHVRLDWLQPEKSKLYKTILSPIWHYTCHPNCTMRDLASRLRQFINSNFQIQEQRDQHRKEKKWYDVYIPNWYGRIVSSLDFAGNLLRAKEVEKDVLSLKSKISRIIASNEKRNFASAYFPLVMTNGCYYTHDLKHIVSVNAESSESIVVGGDVEIGEAADFGRVRKIIVKPDGEGWLETWYDALRDPTNLIDVCVGDDDVAVGKASNLIYERSSGRIINIYGNEKSITIPANLVVSDIDIFVKQLQCHSIDRLHFGGSLPTFTGRVIKDSYRRRIARWWKYGGWQYFASIFEKKEVRPFLDQAPQDLVVTVSRQNDDERTKKIVGSGMWEGRPIRWEESE